MFSHFRNSARPAIGDTSIIGVTRAARAIRSRAAVISSSVTNVIGCGIVLRPPRRLRR
jgi:hypothetical protein